MLEATACAIQTETEGAEGTTQSSSRLPPLVLQLKLGAQIRWGLLPNVRRLQTTADISTLNMQEVTASAEGANAKGAEIAAGNVPATVQGGALLGPLLGGAVDEQAAAAVVAVAGGVVGTTQLRLILWVTEGNVEFVKAMGKLAAFCILAEASSGVAGAEFSLVAGGADPGDQGRTGGLYQGKEGLGQGKAFTTISIQFLTGQQVVHQLLILAGRQEQVITTGL